MKSLRLEESILVDTSPEQAFDYTQDYTQRLVWDTFLQRAELMDGAGAAGSGVRAYCVAHNGMGMVTEYISFRRPEVTAIKMTEGPYMFKTFQGSWRFKQEGTQTRVIFLYSFTLRFPFSMAGAFVLTTLQRNVRQRLKDLQARLTEIYPQPVHP